MKEIEKIREQDKETSAYLEYLNKLIPDFSRIQNLLNFNIQCFDYAAGNIPHETIDEWSQANPIFMELSRRLEEVFHDPPQNAILKTYNAETTAGSSLADTYSFILNNISHITGVREREGFRSISATYNQFINGEEVRKEIHSFLYRINPLAASKFMDGSSKLMNPGEGEDETTALNNLRSAMNLTIRTLIDQINSPKAPTQNEIFPRISRYYGRDQIAQVDLAVRNRNFLFLWVKLSKAGDLNLSGDYAIGMALEVISTLYLLSRTLKLSRK